jgi:hypothetical protein
LSSTCRASSASIRAATRSARARRGPRQGRESLRRTSIAELHLIAAPGDASGSATLGMQRATRVHDYLRSRGVPAGRLAKPSTAPGAAVQLRIEAQSPA